MLCQISIRTNRSAITVCKGEFRIMAGGAGLGIIYRKAGIIKKITAQGCFFFSKIIVCKKIYSVGYKIRNILFDKILFRDCFFILVPIETTPANEE